MSKWLISSIRFVHYDKKALPERLRPFCTIPITMSLP